MFGGSQEVNSTTETASHTLDLTNKSSLIYINVASANVVTVPLNATEAFKVGTVIGVNQKGAGVTTITGATGVTINGVSAGSGAIANQYDTAVLIYEGSDAWTLNGTDTVA